MDEITYTAFKIANEIGTTNENDLIGRVKDKFTLSEFASIEKTIHALFSLSSAYFEPYFIGIIILDKSRYEMRMTIHAKNLFLEEKAKRDIVNKKPFHKNKFYEKGIFWLTAVIVILTAILVCQELKLI